MERSFGESATVPFSPKWATRYRNFFRDRSMPISSAKAETMSALRWSVPHVGAKD